MSSEEKAPKLEKRVKSVEEADVLLTELIASHDERLIAAIKTKEELSAKISAPW